MPLLQLQRFLVWNLLGPLPLAGNLAARTIATAIRLSGMVAGNPGRAAIRISMVGSMMGGTSRITPYTLTQPTPLSSSDPSKGPPRLGRCASLLEQILRISNYLLMLDARNAVEYLYATTNV